MIKKLNAFSINESERIDKSKLADIRKELDAALAEVARKRGWKQLNVNQITYHDSGFSATVHCNTGLITAEVRQWLSNWGFPADFIDSTFQYKGNNYRVMSVDPSKRYQISASTDAGKDLSFDANFFKAEILGR